MENVPEENAPERQGSIHQVKAVVGESSELGETRGWVGVGVGWGWGWDVSEFLGEIIPRDQN